MGRIIAIDYGLKRTGLAWTDPLKIIASGIGTIPTNELMAKMKSLIQTENVEAIVMGMPNLLSGEATDSTGHIRQFKKKLEKEFPTIPVSFWDESFSSSRAMDEMIRGGVPKKKRGDKHLVNEVAAVLILQDYLSFKS